MRKQYRLIAMDETPSTINQVVPQDTNLSEKPSALQTQPTPLSTESPEISKTRDATRWVVLGFLFLVILFLLILGAVWVVQSRSQPAPERQSSIAVPTATTAPPIATPTLGQYFPQRAIQPGWKKDLTIKKTTPDQLEFTIHSIEAIEVSLPLTEEEKQQLEASGAGQLVSLFGNEPATAKVAIDVSVTNHSPESVGVYGWDFKLKDELDHELQNIWILAQKKPDLQTIVRPGETTRGYLTFTVPLDVKTLTFYRVRQVKVPTQPGSAVPPSSQQEEYDTFPL